MKSNALINASPCHPYFASVCDQLRLHSYCAPRHNQFETMRAPGCIASPARVI